jgi:fructosamine-3-kinase
VTRVDLDGGRAGFAKSGAGVAAEAAGLRWLAVPGGPAVPQVLSCDGDRLVTEYVATVRPTPAAAAVFGRELAIMHDAGAPAFGAAPPGGRVDAWIGNAPMRNEPGELWPSWYAEHRVLPYLRRARDAGTLDAADARPVEELCARLPELAGPAEPPARLHGDLWSGNVLWGADGRVWLIDPAAHGGHRETDLAMLALFGCPHLDVVRSAYSGESPLAAGWEQRIGLHQLFPLLVHVVLFGAGYAAQTVAAARSALRLAGPS